MSTKKFRSDLFIHLDGIALTPALSSIFDSNYKKLEKLKSLEPFVIQTQELTNYKINSDYLNVTLRLFESQGWIKREWLNDEEIKICTTDYGYSFFENSKLYADYFQFYEHLSTFSFSNDENSKILNQILEQHQLISSLNVNNKIILKHIEGVIIGPILVSLFLNNYLSIDKNGKMIFNGKITTKNKNFIINLFENFGFMSDTLALNEKGLFFCKRSSAYGVTVSYMPLFSKMNKLLYGNTSNILDRDLNGKELHVNRKMNVWGSGGAHKLYFKKIDEIIIEIFNYPIEKQPKGISDMGCGDGTMLIHLYNLIKEKTLRGEILDKHPLYVIGADFNKEALDVTHENLNHENINHILIQAYIGNPNDFNNQLINKHDLKLNELLNVRSFLDHNRIFEMPDKTKFNLKNISTNSTAAFCINNSNKILNPIIFKISLIEHFLKWKPHISKFGLILLELHTINPVLCSQNIGKTLATAYDATHGYSNQYIIEYGDFLDSALMAGLKNKKTFEFNFPSKELTTVSINLFHI